MDSKDLHIKDGLTRSAWLSGRSADDFARAARSNSRAVWVYTIIGMLVWWFGGGKWALILAGLAVWSAISTVLATVVQMRLERIEASLKGTATADAE